MKTHHFAICRFLAIVLVSCAVSELGAQVPQVLNFQGRVIAGGTNFHGTGQFKFALVNANGTTTYWSNDGTSTGGSEPLAAVSLPVAKGLYSVLIGDTGLTNMAAIPASVWSNSDVHLRIWFDGGVNGSQLLAPDQRIAAVAYAMVAGTVPDQSITSSKIAPGAVGGEQLAPNAVQATHIAAGTVSGSQLAPGAAASNLQAGGAAAVPTGGLILSASANNPAMLSAGYQRVGQTLLGENWLPYGTVGEPSPRTGHSAVWTGSEMIIYGGSNGARFNPTSNTWTALPTSGAPSPRGYHVAVWTGSEMIVWSGSYLNDGARYSPTTNTWTPMSTLGAPVGRSFAKAVWTGSKMIAWGGNTGNSTTYVNDGGIYDPVADTWTALPLALAPPGRRNHTMVWTGAEVIVWGGYNGSAALASGARYNPSTNAWTPTSSTNAPIARYLHSAIWTGTEMILWGGYTGSTPLGIGSRYNPTTDSWTQISNAGAPVARNSHSAIWTGTEMILWGGFGGSAVVSDGARYDVASGTWTPTTAAGTPVSRAEHTAVWTGEAMIVWGGLGVSGTLAATGYYVPGRFYHLFQLP